MNSEDRSELIALYQVTVQDLAFFKKQQWSITNYALLLDAAIVGALHVVGPTLTSFERVVAAGLAIVVGVLAWNLVADFAAAIEVRRARLKKTLNFFGATFSEAWSAKLKPDDHGESAGESDVDRVTRILRVAIVAGAIVTAGFALRELSL
jgi:hypothetical protein